jgi:hypothetical protein
MADNILTPYFRAGFISVFKPSKPTGSNQDPKYSIRALFPPTTNLSDLKKAAEQVAKEKWPAGVPKTMRSPFRRNEELENPVPGIGDDWIVMTFSAPADKRPGILDAKLQDIIDEVEVYSGAWYRAQIRPFAYEQQGNKGVSFGLQNVQKVKDDEPLGAGRTPANKAFDAVADAGSGDAGSLFD